MVDYKLIALDMDGTALNDAKEITPGTGRAIHEALRRGKEVIFCTGRSLAEMRPILKDYPDMHYLLAESGAFLYDLQNRRVMESHTMSAEVVRALCTRSRMIDVMPMIFSRGEMYLTRKHLTRFPRYEMSQYEHTMPLVATPVDDMYEFGMQHQEEVEKFNLYHMTPADREESRRFLEPVSSLAEIVDSETTCLECSPKGIAKGVALKKLGEMTGIPVSEMIMVGDADNDLDALRTAGLPIAMGNANENVKAVCKETVADNEHDGCAEAIYRFLLRE